MRGNICERREKRAERDKKWLPIEVSSINETQAILLETRLLAAPRKLAATDVTECPY